MSGKQVPVEPRIKDRTRRLPDGCHEWTGYKNPSGYGRMSAFGTYQYVHRVVLFLKLGFWPGEVDHLCRNPSCINPEHLEEVTHLENIRRGFVATKTSCVAGHDFSGDNLYRRPITGYRVCRECARRRDRERYRRKVFVGG